jgi:hypothetical protein
MLKGAMKKVLVILLTLLSVVTYPSFSHADSEYDDSFVGGTDGAWGWKPPALDRIGNNDGAGAWGPGGYGDGSGRGGGAFGRGGGAGLFGGTLTTRLGLLRQLLSILALFVGRQSVPANSTLIAQDTMYNSTAPKNGSNDTAASPLDNLGAVQDPSSSQPSYGRPSVTQPGYGRNTVPSCQGSSCPPSSRQADGCANGQCNSDRNAWDVIVGGAFDDGRAGSGANRPVPGFWDTAPSRDRRCHARMVPTFLPSGLLPRRVKASGVSF